MKRLRCMSILQLAFAGLLAAPLLATQPAQDPKKPAAKKKAAAKKSDTPPTKSSVVFGLDKVWHFHLEVSAKEYAAMQPAGGKGFPGPGGFGGPPGFGGPKKALEKPADPSADVHKGAGFGLEFPWVHAEFSAEGKTFKNVGLRYKGNFTYISTANGLKRPLQIDLDRFDDQNFNKLRKLNLSNGVTDPARSRESVGFALFRAAGVPAPRTAYAEVTLTVPGKFDKEFVGLYTVVEHVGNGFLKDHFKSAKGFLLKPEGLRGLDYFGEDWKPYEQKYRPKSDAEKKQQDRLIAFTRLVNKGDDEQFKKEIASFLDVDEFLRYLAVNALIANLDSLLGFGHNFFMYLRPDTNQFVFIPWDLDLSMGTWPVGGQPQQQMELSVNHPHIGQHKLIDRLLAMKDVQEKYQSVLKELTTTCFTKEKLLKDIDVIEQATKDSLAKERKAMAARKEGAGGFGPPGGAMFGHSLDLRDFVDKRTKSVLAQLNGTSKGYVPAGMGFGPPGGFGGGPPGGPGFGGGPPGGFGVRPPQPGEILPQPWQQMLKLSDEQKKQLGDLQKETEGKLQRILTDEQNKQLKNLRDRGPGFGPPGGPGGFGPGFGPPPVVERKQ